MLAAGRRSLKTEISKRQLVLALTVDTGFDDPRYFFGAPTQGQAERIAWNDFLKLTPKHWIKSISKEDHCITTWWGSELWVVGLDVPERIEGVSWDGCVIDERADIKPGAWLENIEPALSDREGWSRHIGVPDYKGRSSAEFKELFDKAIMGLDPEWLALTWKSTEVLPDHVIQRAMRNQPLNIFLQEYEASFQSAPGRAYYEFQKKDHVKPTDFLDFSPIHVGCDFNAEHHNWGMYQVQYPDSESKSRYQIFDEIYGIDARVEHQCNKLEDKLKVIGSQVGSDRYLKENGWLHFYGDASGTSRSATATRTAWNQIQDKFPHAQFHYSKRNPAIADRMNGVNGVLRNALGEVRLQVDPRCVNHIRDFEYVTSTMLYGQKKSGALTHASDCFGYFVVQYLDLDPTKIVTLNGNNFLP